MSPHSRRYTLQSLALAVAAFALPAQAYIDAPSQARAEEHAERGRGAPDKADKSDKSDKADKSNKGSTARATGNAPATAAPTATAVPAAAAAGRK